MTDAPETSGWEALSGEGPRSRLRPSVHFTAIDGWINDPYGIQWDGEQYHLYYQAIPGRVTWAPNCHWGHAVSPDLVHWHELPLALAPRHDEVGCWSGSAVHRDGREPILVYTRVAGEDLGRGAVALATPDGSERAVVIDGPPADLGVYAFRDPYVWPTDEGWRLLMAAGLEDGRAAALQYSSPDLRSWRFDGVLASRAGDERDGTWTGRLWECPQLFELDGTWVLFVSVWNDDVLHYVAAATGAYDGSRFAPSVWQRLTFGDSAYATTAFADRDGRRCALSWLREEPQNDSSLVGFAGAHSVAATVRIVAGEVRLDPHPDVLALAGDPLGDHADVESAILVQWEAGAAVRLQLVDNVGLRLSARSEGSELVLERAGRSEVRMPWSGQTTTRIIVDADLVEVFGSCYGAARLRPSADPVNQVIAVGGAISTLSP